MGTKSCLRLRVSKALIMSFVVLALVAARGEAAQNQKPAPARQEVKEAPQYGGVLRTLTSNSVVNLGAPWEARMPTDAQFAQPALECLVRIDGKGLPSVPWLASSWKISKDFKSITFTLRKGVKFQDGTDFNAEAVKANLDMVRK
jgi:peptide/nickel transport system substrate-binding protein